MIQRRVSILRQDDRTVIPGSEEKRLVESRWLVPGFWHTRHPLDYIGTQVHLEVLAEACLKNQTVLVVEGGTTLAEGWEETMMRAAAELPEWWRVLFLGPDLVEAPQAVSERLVESAGMYGPWAYVVNPAGAWRLHEHLKYWPRLLVHEAMAQVGRMERGYLAMAEKVATPRG